MSIADLTKREFADQLEQLLKTNEFEKIHITDLCRHCGVHTQTFYYHFHDKYELVRWIFVNDFVGEADEIIPDFSMKSYSVVMQRFTRRRAFYRKVCRDTSQNSLVWFFHSFNTRIAMAAVQKANGSIELNERQQLDIWSCSWGLLGAFMSWLYNDLPISAESVAAYQLAHTPPYLQRAFAEFLPSREELLKIAFVT